MRYRFSNYIQKSMEGREGNLPKKKSFYDRRRPFYDGYVNKFRERKRQSLVLTYEAKCRYDRLRNKMWRMPKSLRPIGKFGISSPSEVARYTKAPVGHYHIMKMHDLPFALNFLSFSSKRKNDDSWKKFIPFDWLEENNIKYEIRYNVLIQAIIITFANEIDLFYYKLAAPPISSAD